MNKTELITKVAEKTGTTKKAAGEAVEAFIATVTETVTSGEKVALVGFGTFEVAERAERTGRNPQTGKAITIAASKSPKFKASKSFKEAVNA